MGGFSRLGFSLPRKSPPGSHTGAHAAVDLHMPQLGLLPPFLPCMDVLQHKLYRIWSVHQKWREYVLYLSLGSMLIAVAGDVCSEPIFPKNEPSNHATIMMTVNISVTRMAFGCSAEKMRATARCLSDVPPVRRAHWRLCLGASQSTLVDINVRHPAMYTKILAMAVYRKQCAQLCSSYPRSPPRETGSTYSPALLLHMSVPSKHYPDSFYEL